MDTKPEGLDGEFARRVIKLMAAVNVGRLQAHRAAGSAAPGASAPAGSDPVPICLVEHRGRRTGKLRTTPLVYLRDGDRVVVVASQAGRPQHPLWFRNIEADPDVTVQIRGDRRPMRARTAAPTERAGSGRGWSTSTATTTPTSRGPTARSRSWSSSRALSRRAPKSRFRAGAVTIRQRGAWSLDQRWPQDEVWSDRHTAAVLQHLTCDPGRRST